MILHNQQTLTIVAKTLIYILVSNHACKYPCLRSVHMIRYLNCLFANRYSIVKAFASITVKLNATVERVSYVL